MLRPGLLLCTFIILAVMSFSCRDKVICPAFQSTYILDDSTRIAFFSYAWKLDEATRLTLLSEGGAPSILPAAIPDSLDSLSIYPDSLTAFEGDPGVGPIQTAELASLKPYFANAEPHIQAIPSVKRSKYGVVKYEPEWLTRYQQRSVPKENILAPEREPSGPRQVDVGEFVAEDFSTDTLGFDSTLTVVADSIITLDELDTTTLLATDSAELGPPLAVLEEPEKPEEPKGPQYLYGYDPADDFNVEQDYYNKYFGKYLIKQKRPKKVEPILEPMDSTLVQPDTSLVQADTSFVQPDTTVIEQLPPVPADTTQNGDQ